MNGFTKKREMRIALCTECNFDCFFCHSEGLDRKEKDTRQPVEKIIALIDRAMELGFSDITFTGGEPLLRHKDIASILDQLGARKNELPDITIVSNTSFLPPAMLNSVRDYPGKIKFNVSLHSIDSDKFKKIVRVDENIETVLENIRILVGAQIKVKLNSVVLNGLNSGSKAFEAFLNRAMELGVAGIKFLELLITPSTRDHYSYFYSDEAIWRDLKELRFTEQHATLRTRLLSSPLYPGLPVEITRCTCKLGCVNCSEYRDRQFDSQLRIHPCFVLSDESFGSGENKDALAQVMKQVDSSIARYAKTYGNDSPILIPQEVYVESKEEVFFSSKKSREECDTIMHSFGYNAQKKRSFHLIFCLPESVDSEWSECKKVMKYGFDLHTPNKFEIIFSKEKYSTVNGSFISKSSYMSERPAEIPAQDIDHAKQYIQSFGYETWFEKTFHINDYINKKNGAVVSVDYSTTPINLKIDAGLLNGNDTALILRELDAQAITIPFPQWLKRHVDQVSAVDLSSATAY